MNLRNTILAATFDLSVLDMEERTLLVDLLNLSSTDHRVKDVVPTDTAVEVVLHSNARTQDSQEPFGLSDAFDVLVDQHEAEEEDFMFLSDNGDDL